MKARLSALSQGHLLLPFLLLASAGALLYGHTTEVTFYLDDIPGIVENYVIYDLPSALARVVRPRGLVDLTFAVNFRLSAQSIAALHLTNIAIHVVNGWLVFLLLSRLVADRWLALLGALLFIAHPLQTQAVTYLIQRAASLGALFFLLAVLGYLRARDALAEGAGRSSPRYLYPYVAAVVAGGAAVFCKENTATLPLLLVVYDRLFPRPALRSGKPAALDYLPFVIFPLLAGGIKIWTLAQGGFQSHSPLTTLQGNGPLPYLVTQFSVMWEYFRLLVFPWGQALEHNYPVVDELLSIQSVLALAGLLMLGAGAWTLRRQRPLLAFGVAWFFLALVVESSIIPLDPLVEHRLYLPLAGFVMVLVDSLPAVLSRRRSYVLLVMMLLLLAPLAWWRNELWTDPQALYEDNLRRHPDSERAREYLANIYQDAGRTAEAQQLLEQGLSLTPKSLLLTKNLAFLLESQGRIEEALHLLRRSFSIVPEDTIDYAALVSDTADVYLKGRQPQAAIQLLQSAATKQPARQSLYLNKLAMIYASLGEVVRAEQLWRTSLASQPNTAEAKAAHVNLASHLIAQERWAEALQELRAAWELVPGDPEVLEGVVTAALMLEDLATARWALHRLQYIDAGAFRRLDATFRDKADELARRPQG